MAGAYPEKNGHQQAQDRQLSVHEERMTQLDSKIDRNFHLNEQQHSAIRDILHDIQISIENIRGDIRGSKLVASVVFAIFILAMGGFGWLVNTGASTIEDTATKLNQLDARTSADWANGRKWGEKLDKDIERLDLEIRTLRQRINDSERHHRE